MGQRERNKEAKRARIAAAARELFVEHGFEGTTIRAIARRAGVGTGTVPLYFTSKADLLVGLFVDDLEGVVNDRLATVPDAPLKTQLLHVFTGFLQLYGSQPELYRVYVKESMFASGPQADRYDVVTQGFLASLGQVVRHRADELRDGVDPGALAIEAFSLYLVQVGLFLRTPEPRVDATLALLGLLLDGLLDPLRR